MKALHAICGVLLTLALGGCATTQPSLPLSGDVAARGLALARALPALPSGAVAVPGSQYIVVNAASAGTEIAEMLVPIPFVAEMAVDGLHRHAAEGYQHLFAAVDPFAIAAARFAGSPLLSTRAGAMKALPVVYLVEGGDARWRLSLALRIDGQGWTGRYLYHLPTTYSADELRNGTATTAATLRSELIAGTDVLRALMERDARGELRGTGAKVEFGSLYVVGSDLMGMLPARLMRFSGADLLEESPDHVVLRASGDLHADAGDGALAFGVHYFRRDQLHDFKKTSKSAS